MSTFLVGLASIPDTDHTGKAPCTRIQSLVVDFYNFSVTLFSLAVDILIKSVLTQSAEDQTLYQAAGGYCRDQRS